MEYHIILVRSVTFAQRIQKALNKAGVRCWLLRAPRELTELGCAYTVCVSPRDLPGALAVIRRERLPIVSVYHFQQGAYRRVVL